MRVVPPYAHVIQQRASPFTDCITPRCCFHYYHMVGTLRLATDGQQVRLTLPAGCNAVPFNCRVYWPLRLYTRCTATHPTFRAPTRTHLPALFPLPVRTHRLDRRGNNCALPQHTAAFYIADICSHTLFPGAGARDPTSLPTPPISWCRAGARCAFHHLLWDHFPARATTAFCITQQHAIAFTLPH